MEEKAPKKKKSIFLFFLGMLAVFVVIFFTQQYLGSLIANSLSSLKFGEDTLFEVVWAGLVLIVLLLFRNKYVFTQEGLSFGQGLKYILPEIILSIIFFIIMLISFIGNGGAHPLVIVNLLIYCFFIGIVEEFLCRGWLFNEFMERFSSTRKGIILSILLSSLIFGALHFVNIGETQGFIDTLFQVINATVGGIFLTLAYYKTKNIWVVVFSHALWDFSLMLGETTKFADCYVNSAPTGAIVLNSILTSLVCTAGYLLLCFWLFRQTDLYDKGKEKIKDDKKTYLMVAGIVIYLCAFFVIPTPDGYDNYMICPTYETKEVEKEYKWAVDLSSEYKLSLGSNYFNEDGLLVTNEEYSYVLTSNGVTGEIEFKNILNDNKISLAEKYKNYLLIENKDDFIIIIETSYTTVLYGRYPKILANNEEDFLKLVKNGLKEYHVPDIYLITTLQFPKDEYTYASIKLDLGDRMFFDKDDKLYVIE